MEKKENLSQNYLQIFLHNKSSECVKNKAKKFQLVLTQEKLGTKTKVIEDWRP